MGLIRKSLYLASAGAVAPNSKKQRRAAQTLAAVQGATPAEIRRAGGRTDPWVTQPTSVRTDAISRAGSLAELRSIPPRDTLTYRDKAPARAAYKAARRSGATPEQASAASRAVMVQLRAHSHNQNQ